MSALDKKGDTVPDLPRPYAVYENYEGGLEITDRTGRRVLADVYAYDAEPIDALARMEAIVAALNRVPESARDDTIIPPGWKAMPPELTEEMMKADRDAADKWVRGQHPPELAEHEHGQAVMCYRAVFAAAPSATPATVASTDRGRSDG